MRMMWKTAPAVVALLLGSVAWAAAADFCIDSNNGVNTLAVKAFALPAKGMCNDYRGFYVSGPFWVRGSACGSSDNATVTFFSTGYSEAGTLIFTDKFSLSRHTLTGTGSECFVNTVAGQCVPSSYQKIACSPAVVPVPE